MKVIAMLPVAERGVGASSTRSPACRRSAMSSSSATGNPTMTRARSARGSRRSSCSSRRRKPDPRAALAAARCRARLRRPQPAVGTDADELVSPARRERSSQRERERLNPGTRGRVPLSTTCGTTHGEYRNDLLALRAVLEAGRPSSTTAARTSIAADGRAAARAAGSRLPTTRRSCGPTTSGAASAVADPAAQPDEAGVVSLPRVARRRRQTPPRSTSSIR